MNVFHISLCWQPLKHISFYLEYFLIKNFIRTGRVIKESKLSSSLQSDLLGILRLFDWQIIFDGVDNIVG